MLQLSTIDPSTLELLKSLMAKDEFQNLRLAGGTGLALQIGHRKSIDLDLFGEIDFEDIDISQTFGDYNKVISLKRSRNINILNINDVKVDFVNYSYPWLQNQIITNGVRIATKEDIAAMKLAAITGRGTRKDFIDLYYLLQEYSLGEMLGFYRKKYFDGSEYMVLKSLTYFDDAEQDVNIEMVKDTSWPMIRKYILDCVETYNIDNR